MSSLLRRLVAPNPSPFTFTGTCSYIVGQGRVAIVDEGKHADAVRQALREMGTRFAANTKDADVLVIGTLSPGPMLDALDKRRVGPRPVILPWRPEGMRAPVPSLLGPPPVLREAI